MRVHRKAELIRYQVSGSRALRIYAVEQEIMAYEQVRGGDPHG